MLLRLRMYTKLRKPGALTQHIWNIYITQLKKGGGKIFVVSVACDGILLIMHHYKLF